jgi:putative ABC transport system ATP-binding protein
VVNALVQLQKASRIYGDGAARPALDRVSLELPTGQFTAVMGPSGSGKSTLLNLVAGLDRPTSGAVFVDGRDLGRMGEAALARFRRERIGFVFQFFNLLPTLTALENVLVPAQLAGVKAAAAEARASELFERLGLAGAARSYPARLSGGQQQRVAIARALVNRPALLLADEPTGALDTSTGAEVMELLAQLHREGLTVLLVTHDPKLAARHAERVVSLRDGRVVDDARLSDTGAEPADLLRLRVTEAAL